MKKVIILIILFACFSSYAQDKIVKRSGEIINCNVTEVGSAEIKYNYTDKPLVVFGIDKALVDKVEFATGEIIEVENNTFMNTGYYADQNKRALKFNFLTPLSNNIEFSYEQSVKPGQSWETALGIIGLGYEVSERNPGGVYGKFAYKFLKSPDFYMQNMHYAHILKGAYIAPELAVRYVEFDEYFYENWNYFEEKTRRESDFCVALNLKFGKQWVFSDSFLVDTYFGIGYGFSTNADAVINYGFIVGNGDFPISATAGIRLGWTF